MTKTLPAPRNPFPVRVPFQVGSDLYPLGKPLYGDFEATIFMIDSGYYKTIQERLRILREYPEHGRAYLDDDLPNLAASLWELVSWIAQDQPEYATYDGDKFTSKLLGISLCRDNTLNFQPEQAIFPELAQACHEHLRGMTAFERLCDMLTLSIQEDIVIGRVNPETGADVMECLLVALPSHWIPLEKLGLSFAETHGNIPENQRLMKASSQLVKAILSKSPFVRYNWTVSTHHLARNPCTEPNYEAERRELAETTDPELLMERLHFRSERQTFVSFPTLNRYAFIIHTYSHPMRKALNTPERWATMQAVLPTFSPELLDYKTSLKRVLDRLSDILAKGIS